ncbi:hypothetical protein [Streptomyces sp. NPDC101455]|uniref:hypothetical protein n=1 Tax=Streptomyces sp. NPDC101455 TaxID=3366142 RepID=UPI00381B55D8
MKQRHTCARTPLSSPRPPGAHPYPQGDGIDGTPILYTAPEAAAKATEWRRSLSAGAAEVTVDTIWKWRSRGHLTAVLHHGRLHVEHSDLAHAEKTTRARALRLVGISAQ